MDDLFRILAVLGLVLANAFFVVSEYAVVSGRRAALLPRAEAGSARARAALRLMDDPVRVISTVQVGITAIGILTGAIGEPLVRDVLGDGLPGWAGFLIAFATVTYLSVVLGELVPKALTLDRADKLAMLVAAPTELIARILRPGVWVLERSAAVVLRPFGVSEVIAGDSIRSVEELRAVVDEAEELGLIPQAQEEMLHNLFRFATREARDVMVPALDVDWLDADLRVDEALDQVAQRSHSRLVVGKGSADRVVGVVHMRELLGARNDQNATVEQLARPPFVVPETKDLGALLLELREGREQLAVITNEYGGLAGIVSLEDIVEEIIGEIEDEYDLPDERITWLGDDRVVVSGSMTVDDFNETFGTGLPQDGPRTLAGIVFDALGRGALSGDRVTLADLELRVDEVDGARITRLQIGPLSKPAG